VENWKEAYKNNTGLLLFGDVGTGKSFFAGCIANALLDRDVPVLMTNFPTILNRLTGMFSDDRADFIASFDEYDLLIIDDLGVERSTEYAMEQMFFVIDSRYRSRRPMIITTNLKLAELKNPPDLAHARIYDRILERCAPILFVNRNFPYIFFLYFQANKKRYSINYSDAFYVRLFYSVPSVIIF